MSRPYVISTNWPPPHHSRFPGSSASGQHFGNVQVTTETSKVMTPHEIALPVTAAGIVAEVAVVFQPLGHVQAAPVVHPRVRHDRFPLRAIARAYRRRRSWYETPRVGPIGW